jgi:quercetin dioxygenase-like cupin family protein
MDQGFRRVVTGHDASGGAIVTSDSRLFKRETPVRGLRGVDIWQTAGLPVANSPAPRNVSGSPVSDQRTLIRAMELAPNATAEMHRTLTLDYGVVLTGQCVLALDGGTEIALVPGDVVVQRGTRHAWKNPSSESCTLLFVLMDATAVTIGDHDLEPTFTGEYPAGFDVMRSRVIGSANHGVVESNTLQHDESGHTA